MLKARTTHRIIANDGSVRIVKSKTKHDSTIKEALSAIVACFGLCNIIGVRLRDKWGDSVYSPEDIESLISQG